MTCRNSFRGSRHNCATDHSTHKPNSTMDSTRRRNGSRPVLPTRALGGSLSNKPSINSTTWLALILSSSFTAFYLGIWTAWSINPSTSDLDLCIKAANGDERGELGRKVGDIFKTRLDKGEMSFYIHIQFLTSHNHIASMLSYLAGLFPLI